jgi:hypothetical protein
MEAREGVEYTASLEACATTEASAPVEGCRAKTAGDIATGTAIVQYRINECALKTGRFMLTSL